MNKPKVITNSEAYQLMQHHDELIRVATHIMYDTGLRITDVLNLRVENIKNNSEIVEKKTKKIKKLILSEKTITEIHDFCKNRESGLIFESKRNSGQPINRSTFYRALNRVAIQGGIKVSPHSFRKLYAQNIWLKTQNINEVQKALNHKYIQTTATYLDIDINELILKRLTPQEKENRDRGNPPPIKAPFARSLVLSLSARALRFARRLVSLWVLGGGRVLAAVRWAGRFLVRSAKVVLPRLRFFRSARVVGRLRRGSQKKKKGK